MSAEPLALVVDDSPEQADLLRRFLERAGCRVVTACSAEQAAAVLEDDSVDEPALAVVDLVLPGRSGREFAEELRASHPACVLAITSVLDAAEYPDADAVLPKPFTGEQVRELSARVVGCG